MNLPRGRNLIVLLAALAALIIPVILLENNVLHHTDGAISFPLDNAFLDISVAKNLAFYKVWGVSKYAFQSASTSLLYPLLLVPFFFIAGAHLIIPIIVNTLVAGTFLYFLQKALISGGLRPAAQLGILLAVIFLAPLPLLVVSGMGYPLQLLLCFLFVTTLSTSLGSTATRLPVKLYLLGALSVAARYEDLVLILLACLLLIASKRGKEALKLAGISLIPALLFGAISLAKGSYFLPNSLVLGPYPGYVLYLGIAAFAACILLIRQYQKGATAKQHVSIPRLSYTLLAIMAIPFIARNIATLRHFETDSIRIYEQQYPLAAFVHRYYARATIGVNDIGPVSYFTDGRKLDYTGKASGIVVKSLREHSWGPLLADSLSRKEGIRVAIVSEPWFNLEQFPKWNKIASWKLPDSQFSDGQTLSFYVINAYDTTYMRMHLHEYEPMLPENTQVRYY